MLHLHPKQLHCECNSFVQLPDNNFKTRAHDARSPYNTNSYFDYSTPVTEPIQKIILFGIVYKRKIQLLQKRSRKTYHLLFG
jgi:hypothetical protein